MVKYPRNQKKYCKFCKVHVEMKSYEYKPGKASLNAQGKRRYDRKQQGYGGQTKPVFRKQVKNTKKPSIKLSCEICKKEFIKSLKRTKRFQITIITKINK
ncbi:ribosomal protein L44 (nucleomorph) [Bigelowiella natans]|uniref:Ribosomal protein L44 n=1 Tax=Bigelowiella natans TaxID=227086 RepID=Q3LWA2_BIGNA|nr:ribosomal protein L44 [Bigelowiella natans]ABA27264.1 ribosomal protein L44 [Bigelowiella natans]